MGTSTDALKGLTMFRSVLFKGFAALCSLIFLASPASAAFDGSGIGGKKNLEGMDMSRARVWVDQTCTDSFSVPATTVNVNLTTVGNWDAMNEAINPDKNIGNAVQTSGSADGWCDSTPWVIRGTFTMGASQNLFLGPFRNIPKQGFNLVWDFDAIITNYAWWFGYATGINLGSYRDLGGMAASTTLTTLQAEIIPTTWSSSVFSTFDNFQFIQGRPQYLRLATTGAGVFTFGLETIPFLPYYEEQ